MMDQEKNPHAVALGKLGGQKVAEKGPEYYAEIQAKRKSRAGGRPKGPPRAICEAPLKIGDLEIPCAVLEGGVRVISERGVAKGLGVKRGGSHWVRKGAGAEMPVYLSASNLKPFIDSDLELALSEPILYRPKGGGGTAHGIPAESLPKICEVWLKARDADALHRQQNHIAEQADVLIRAFAHVGIIALVDEVTGYQDLRSRQALAEILDQFLVKERSKWAKRFPDDYYKEMFRLRGWSYYPVSVRRPPLVGKITNDSVYDRLAPGVRRELDRLNPKDARGRRGARHHQWLTPDIGHPKLQEHLTQVVTLMKASENWTEFKKLLNRALPRYPDMPLFDEPTSQETVA